MGVSILRKNSLIKDGMCRVENSISLYMSHKVVSIVFISNEYHQFRVWCKFVSMNFNREKHIGIKFTNNGLCFSLFYFSFSFCFIFLFLEQLGLGLEVISHTVTSVTI